MKQHVSCVDSKLSKVALSLGVQWIFCTVWQAQLERINVVRCRCDISRGRFANGCKTRVNIPCARTARGAVRQYHDSTKTSYSELFLLIWLVGATIQLEPSVSPKRWVQWSNLQPAFECSSLIKLNTDCSSEFLTCIYTFSLLDHTEACELPKQTSHWRIMQFQSIVRTVSYAEWWNFLYLRLDKSYFKSRLPRMRCVQHMSQAICSKSRMISIACKAISLCNSGGI